MEKEISHFYQCPSGTLLEIQAARLPRSVCVQAGNYLVSSAPPRRADVRIVLARRPEDFPPSVSVRKSTYKGFPWMLGAEEGAQVRYFFYAPFFAGFLFTRICLLPLLKKKAVEKGGFLMIGSAFRMNGRTAVLFGRPGSGKTRLLFEALQKGAVWAGDSELEVTSGKEVFPVFPVIESRLKTIAGTPFWQHLSLGQKIYLGFCQAVSVLTARKISFNLLTAPADLKIHVSPAEKTGDTSFFFLDPEAEKPALLTAECFTEAAGNYEKEYQHAYGSGIFNSALLGRALMQMRDVVKGCALWRVPCSVSIHELLKLNQAEK